MELIIIVSELKVRIKQNIHQNMMDPQEMNAD